MLRLATLRLLTSCKMIRYKLNSTLAHRHLLGKKLVPLEIAGINSFSYSKFHTASQEFSRDLITPSVKWNKRDLKIRDTLWMTDMTNLEKLCSDAISHNNLSESALAVVEELLADTKEKLSLALLRNVYLRFRVTVRNLVESKLSSELVPQVPSEEENAFNLIYHGDYEIKHVLDYSHFLNELNKGITSGDLVEFLNQKGISDLAEFYDICEFALKGDQEIFFQIHPFDSEFMEEESSSQTQLSSPFDREGTSNPFDFDFTEEESNRAQNLFSYPFDREGAIKAIDSISSHVINKSNSLKLVDYMLKLSP